MRYMVMFFLVGALAACGEQGGSSKADMPAIGVDAVLPDHNYVMNDGMKYGYPTAISETQRQAGQVAETLVMAMFAGEREGKLQAHITNGTTVTALECERPCQYLKVMTYIDNEYLKNQIQVEHIAATPNSIGALVMRDAMNGKLKRYGIKIGSKRYGQWVDEQKGMINTALPEKNDAS